MKPAVLRRKRNKNERSGFLKAVISIVILILTALFLARFIFYSVTMNGHSMESCIMQGDVLLVNRLEYKISSPKRYDVIVFYGEKNSGMQVKRIVGLPGESVEIKDNNIYINDIMIDDADEYFKMEDLSKEGTRITLNDGEYYVLGDNPLYSEDSRSDNIGTVKDKNIVGRVWFIIKDFLSFEVL